MPTSSPRRRCSSSRTASSRQLSLASIIHNLALEATRPSRPAPQWPPQSASTLRTRAPSRSPLPSPTAGPVEGVHCSLRARPTSWANVHHRRHRQILRLHALFLCHVSGGLVPLGALHSGLQRSHHVPFVGQLSGRSASRLVHCVVLRLCDPRSVLIRLCLSFSVPLIFHVLTRLCL